MIKVVKFASRLGCLTAVLAPLLAILLYPRANWLFGFVLVGIAIIILSVRLAKDPTPLALADEIERLLTGKYGGRDVDDFESRRIRDPRLRELWHRSMEVDRAPENWVGLGEEGKDRLRKVIRELRALGGA